MLSRSSAKAAPIEESKPTDEPNPEDEETDSDWEEGSQAGEQGTATPGQGVDACASEGAEAGGDPMVSEGPIDGSMPSAEESKAGKKSIGPQMDHSPASGMGSDSQSGGRSLARSGGWSPPSIANRKSYPKMKTRSCRRAQYL